MSLRWFLILVAYIFIPSFTPRIHGDPAMSLIFTQLVCAYPADSRGRKAGCHKLLSHGAQPRPGSENASPWMKAFNLRPKAWTGVSQAKGRNSSGPTDCHFENWGWRSSEYLKNIMAYVARIWRVKAEIRELERWGERELSEFSHCKGY